MKIENTTIKISKSTKRRLDYFKEYKRESYEEIIEKILDVLNTCKINPMKARAKLMKIDREHKENVLRLEEKEKIV